MLYRIVATSNCSYIGLEVRELRTEQMNKFRQQIIKLINILVLLMGILIIALVFYITFKLFSVPDWYSRSSILQVNHELRKAIKSSTQFLQFLLTIETVIIWLSILLNLFIKPVPQANWSSRLLLHNAWIGLLSTIFILFLYLCTMPIMSICDYPYC